MNNPLILSTAAGMRVAEIVEFSHATGYVLVRIIPGGIPVRVRMSELAIGKAA